MKIRLFVATFIIALLLLPTGVAFGAKHPVTAHVHAHGSTAQSLGSGHASHYVPVHSFGEWRTPK